MFYSKIKRPVSSVVEHLFCKQAVLGSIPRLGSIFVLSIFLTGCASPAPRTLRLLEVDFEETEYWERPDGTRYIRFEMPDGTFRTMEAR